MTGINALSTRGTILSAEDGALFTGGLEPGADSAALNFAAIFGGWLNQIGQGQDSGNQSKEPAGKEANSGHHALLGLEGLQGLVGILQGKEDIQEEANPKQLEMLLSQLDKIRNLTTPANPEGTLEVGQLSGMTDQSQGNTFKSELDLYKNLISNLLKDMSGEVRVKTQSVAEFNPLALQKSELAVQRFASGLFLPMEGEGFTLVTDPEVLDATTANMALKNGEVADAELRATVPETAPTETVKTRGNGNVVANQATLFAALLGKSRSSSQEPGTQENQLKTTANTVINPKILDAGIKDAENIFLKEEIAKGLTQSSKESGDRPGAENITNMVKNPQATAFSIEDKPTVEGFVNDHGIEGTILNQTKEASQILGRIADRSEQPIWSQIARDIFDKAYLARPQLREMTIHLQPAHLGEINITMSWEEGQIHLRMVASETGTGQLLQANLAELRDNLTQLGIQCGQMEMGEQKEGAQEHRERKDSARSQESGDETLELLDGDELNNLMNSEDWIPGVNRINVRA